MNPRLSQSGDGAPSEQFKKMRTELCDLFRKQAAALEDATFLGMNDEQARAFDKRRERITELTAMIEKSKAA
jgi:hypothetical protein